MRFRSRGLLRASLRSGALSGAEDYARAKLSRSLAGPGFPETHSPFQSSKDLPAALPFPGSRAPRGSRVASLPLARPAALTSLGPPAARGRAPGRPPRGCVEPSTARRCSSELRS